MKTLLSLDGGGMRGLIALGFLARMERIGGAAPLSERFDFVGGTSTGALIGAAISLGHPVSEIQGFYTDLAPNVFKRSRWRLPGVHALFDDEVMDAHIAEICGDRTMDTADLQTGLGIVVKRLDQDAVWIVTNNPGSPYWDNPDDGRFIGNRHYRIADLVRAATAAPHYFDPEPIPVADEDHGVFIDAGVTPYNNPALALLQLVARRKFGFGWPLGVEHLRIVSVGTGHFRNHQPAEKVLRMSSATLALSTLMSSVRHGSQMVQNVMQFLGRTERRWTRDGTLQAGADPVLPAPLFEYHRFDVRLESDWLARELDLSVPETEIARLRRLDDTGMTDLAIEIGARAADRMIPADLFDPGGAGAGTAMD